MIGPHQNGGVGTHTYWLSRVLADNGFDVVLLYTGIISFNSSMHWQMHYAELGIEFVFVDDVVPHTGLKFENNVFRKSYAAYHYLRSHDFDIIHFQEMEANAHACLQAKDSLGEFSQTRLVVTVHSNFEWLADAMSLSPPDPLVTSLRSWMERYCVAKADWVVSPSRHMLKWIRQHDWSLPKGRTRVLPYCYVVDKTYPHQNTETGHLALFGRLETRKGLLLFLNALRSLPAVHAEKIQHVYFVGKVGETEFGPAPAAISKLLRSARFNYSVVSELHSEEALQFLIDKKATVFLPSTVDNYPYTAIECSSIGIPVLGSDSGGIPEILHQSNCFEPSVAGIRRAIVSVLEHDRPRLRSKYDPEKANRTWLEFNKSLLGDSVRGKVHSGKKAAQRQNQVERIPNVSVCIPATASSENTKKSIRSLLSGNLANLEILIAEESTEVKVDLSEFENWDDDVKLAVTRVPVEDSLSPATQKNILAELAKSKYLAFIDPGACVSPEWLECCIRAIAHSGAEIVATGETEIANSAGSDAQKAMQFKRCPLNPSLEVSVVGDHVGSRNFLVQSRIFWKVGGFNAQCAPGQESWEFWARVSTHNVKAAIIPRHLVVCQRNAPQQLTHSFYQTRAMILDLLRKEMTDWQWRAIRNTMLPAKDAWIRHRRVLNKPWFKKMMSAGIEDEVEEFVDSFDKLKQTGIRQQISAIGRWFRFPSSKL